MSSLMPFCGCEASEAAGRMLPLVGKSCSGSSEIRGFERCIRRAPLHSLRLCMLGCGVQHYCTGAVQLSDHLAPAARRADESRGAPTLHLRECRGAQDGVRRAPGSGLSPSTTCVSCQFGSDVQHCAAALCRPFRSGLRERNCSGALFRKAPGRRATRHQHSCGIYRSSFSSSLWLSLAAWRQALPSRNRTVRG